VIVLAPVCKNLKSVLFRALLKKFRRHPLSAMYAGVLFSGGRGSCPMLAVGPECAWLLLLTACLSMGFRWARSSVFSLDISLAWKLLFPWGSSRRARRPGRCSRLRRSEDL